jgi:hypothetical protein
MSFTGFDDDVIDVSFHIPSHLSPKALRMSLWKVAPVFFQTKGMQT